MTRRILAPLLILAILVGCNQALCRRYEQVYGYAHTTACGGAAILPDLAQSCAALEAQHVVVTRLCAGGGVNAGEVGVAIAQGARLAAQVIALWGSHQRDAGADTEWRRKLAEANQLATDAEAEAK